MEKHLPNSGILTEELEVLTYIVSRKGHHISYCWCPLDTAQVFKCQIIFIPTNHLLHIPDCVKNFMVHTRTSYIPMVTRPLATAQRQVIWAPNLWIRVQSAVLPYQSCVIACTTL